MKAKNVKIIYSFFLIILSVFIFSCKNFCNGSDLIQNLNDAIEYANASYVPVEIKADIDVTKELSPATGKYTEKYKTGDSFEVKFIPTQSYQFVEWKITPESSVSIDNINDSTIKVTILSDSNLIIIEPIVEERPKIIASLPNYEKNGVDRASDIYVIFNQSMSEDSFYYTKDEEDEIKSKNVGKNVVFLTGIINNADYGYYVEENGVIVQSEFKNIQINIRDERTSTNKNNFIHLFFEEPYFESESENTRLVIPTIKNKTNIIPSFAEVEVTINKEFFNNKNISLESDHSFLYKLNAQFDIEAPIVQLLQSNIILDKDDGNTYHDRIRRILKNGTPNTTLGENLLDTLMACETIDEVVRKVSYAKKIRIEGGTFLDDSTISDITCILTPINHKCFSTNGDTTQIKINKDLRNLPSQSDPVVFDFSNYELYKLYGLYQISFEIFDSVGHSILVDKITDSYSTFYFYTVFVTEFSINPSDIIVSNLRTIRKPVGTIPDVKLYVYGLEADISGPPGKYTLLYLQSENCKSSYLLQSSYSLPLWYPISGTISESYDEVHVSYIVVEGDGGRLDLMVSPENQRWYSKILVVEDSYNNIAFFKYTDKLTRLF